MAGNERFTEKFRYEGGYFGKLANTGPPEWREWKTGSGEIYYFEEIRRAGEMIWLKDTSRNFLIQLPVKGRLRFSILLFAPEISDLMR